MKSASRAVFFSAGRDSGPWPEKVVRLAEVAKAKGYFFESVDYSGIADPDERVEKLLASAATGFECTILVGFSMGGYVAAVAAETLQPTGLFLIAPALYLPRYRNQSPQPRARFISVVHGWRDKLVPVENSIRFGRDHGAVVHLFDGDHALANQMPQIARFFGLFLDQMDQGL